ncbi:DDE-type integrase/transposase/recombinase [Mangrovicoccus ximenensis]|uniref:DDE-type integrase/transposase/recombinase n=1 Tax=Mangrovicoccus ximenensis TaxID=1911570 RepID=UPI0011AE3C3C
MSGRLKSSLAMDAMRMALQNRRPVPGLICHSDRGIQYASGDYRRLLDAWTANASMSRKDDCLAFKLA